MSDSPPLSSQDRERPASAAEIEAVVNDAAVSITPELIDRAWKTLDLTIGFNKFLDTKPWPFIGVCGSIFVYVGKELASNPYGPAVLVTGIITLLFLFAGVIYGLLAMSPRVTIRDLLPGPWSKTPLAEPSMPTTTIFYGHVANHPTAGSYTRHFLQDSDSRQWLAQICQQIYLNAYVAREKTRQVRWCIVCSMWGLTFTVLTQVLIILLGKAK